MRVSSTRHGMGMMVKKPAPGAGEVKRQCALRHTGQRYDYDPPFWQTAAQRVPFLCGALLNRKTTSAFKSKIQDPTPFLFSAPIFDTASAAGGQRK